jgi:hypothetical protein
MFDAPLAAPFLSPELKPVEEAEVEEVAVGVRAVSSSRTWTERRRRLRRNRQASLNNSAVDETIAANSGAGSATGFPVLVKEGGGLRPPDDLAG